ncbi:MAG: hypothetical protein AAF996_18605 [Pseudomonadota bacterium]
MIDLFVAIRNFTVALILAWMGFSIAPDSDDQQEQGSAAPSTSFVGLIAG